MLAILFCVDSHANVSCLPFTFFQYEDNRKINAVHVLGPRSPDEISGLFIDGGDARCLNQQTHIDLRIGCTYIACRLPLRCRTNAVSI